MDYLDSDLLRTIIAVADAGSVTSITVAFFSRF